MTQRSCVSLCHSVPQLTGQSVRKILSARHFIRSLFPTNSKAQSRENSREESYLVTLGWASASWCWEVRGKSWTLICLHAIPRNNIQYHGRRRTSICFSTACNRSHLHSDPGTQCLMSLWRIRGRTMAAICCSTTCKLTLNTYFLFTPLSGQLGKTTLKKECGLSKCQTPSVHLTVHCVPMGRFAVTGQLHSNYNVSRYLKIASCNAYHVSDMWMKELDHSGLNINLSHTLLKGIVHNFFIFGQISYFE